MVKKYDITEDESPMLNEPAMSLYSMLEIPSRIDESETQLMNGEVLPGEEVNDKIR